MSTLADSPADVCRPGLQEPGLGAAADAASTGQLDRLRWALSDVRVLTWRTLARIVFRLNGKAGLEQLAWFSPSRWAFGQET